MEDMIKISAIVPVYNAEEYIERCLKSLISQSIGSDIEIIVVNDGSTDRTQKILESYKLKNDNIKIFSIENNGVSHARNLGIQYAKGEYITFVDADDWLDSNCYELMYNVAKREEVDIVAAGICIDSEQGNIITRKLVDKGSKLDGNSAIKEFLFGNLDVHVYNKIFKNEIAKTHRFDENVKIAEDRLFLLECLLDVKKVFFMEQCFYHYFQNEKSVMNQKFSEKNLDNILVGKKINKKVAKKSPDLIPFAQTMYVSMECRLYGEIYKTKQIRNYIKIYNGLKKDIKKFKMIKNLKYFSKKHAVALFLAKVSPALYNYFRNNTALKFKR